MDRKAIIKRVLLQPADWKTLVPFLFGVTLALGAWAVGAESGLALAAGVVVMLLSAGVYLNRLIFGWNATYERVVNEWRQKVEKQRDEELDALYRDLRADGDPRTETLLKDLRTLTKALTSEHANMLATGAVDVLSGVDKLFQRSVDYLRESLQLWRTAEAMDRASIKQKLLEHRESLIVEVEQSLENLGNVLGSIKRSALRSGDHGQLAELRKDMNERLRIAEDVERRMERLRTDYETTREDEEYLRYAPK